MKPTAYRIMIWNSLQCYVGKLPWIAAKTFLINHC